MKATPVTNYIPVDSVNGDFLTVRLEGEEHFDMFQSFKSLAKLIEFRGRIYGKTGWNSDHGEAYYKLNPLIARPV